MPALIPEMPGSQASAATGFELWPGIVAVPHSHSHSRSSATTGAGGLLTYVLVFLVLVLVWCAAGYFFASRPVVAKALSRWGHILLPVVLVTIGLVILVEGHAFGL